MEIRTETTKKDINFINDIDLRINLRERLEELDKVFHVNANYSTIFLAISIIEGIFKHMATIFKTDILKYLNYPLDSAGKPKTIDKVPFMDLYRLLKKRGILPDIQDLEHVYNLYKDYRNFIHPQAQQKKDWPVDLGQAQMALGLLNATIRHLAQYIFIDEEIFRKHAGNPDYDYSESVLRLEVHNTRLHSFLVLDRQISNTLSLNFDLELSHNSSVFNFVFNFVDEGNFKMLRLDNRRGSRTPNSLLYCTQKYLWDIILRAEPSQPPQTSRFPVAIRIDFPKKVFSLHVNGHLYSFKDEKGNVKDLFEEIKRNLKIGFFNELGPVRLSNIS